jgi:hypothetical protein
MIVYRCESPNYLSEGNQHEHPYTKRKSWSPLPSPEHDEIGWINQDEVCGCRSLKQFHKWWPKGKWITKKPKNMYLIFDVPDEYVRKGNTQVVFYREHAKIIGALTKDHKRVFFNESFTYSDYQRQKRERTGNW